MKHKLKGIAVDKKKVIHLVYADDHVLFIKTKDDLNTGLYLL
jgi:copper(I)-binding protein